MIWARWAGVMGVPMKWEIARIFVVGTGGSGFCAEAAPSGVIGFFMAVAPYSSFGILLLIVSVFDARTASAGRPSSPAFRRSIGDLSGCGEAVFEADPVRSADVWASHTGFLCSFGAENGFLGKAGRPGGPAAPKSSARLFPKGRLSEA